MHALLLIVAIGLLAGRCVPTGAGQPRRRRVIGLFGAVVPGLVPRRPTRCPSEFTGMTPYVATLLVLALRLATARMPAADGQSLSKGSRLG